MLRLTRGFCLSTTVRACGPGPWGAGKNWQSPRRERGRKAADPDHGRTKANEPRADQKTAGPQASVLPEWGRRRPLSFENLYGLIRAAEGKVPLLMVCVKRKPLHLVFYAQMGESRTIIPGIRLCRIAGRRTGRGFTRPSSCQGYARRVARDKARERCSFGGRVWEGWKTGAPL